MTEPVRGYSGGGAACYEDSLGRLDDATEDLERTERELERRLSSAVVNTVKVGAACLGNGGVLPSGSCVVAVVQHVQTLLELRNLAAEYQEQAEQYSEALADHYACLSE